MSNRQIEEQEIYPVKIVKSLNSVIPSSWIDRMHWEAAMCKLELLTKDGRVYIYDGITEEDAFEIVTGQAMCKTDDPSTLKRWWIGKTPSLGAAWHYLLPNATDNPAAVPELTEKQAYHAFQFDPVPIVNSILVKRTEEKKIKIKKL